jgi:hypothetical protein
MRLAELKKRFGSRDEEAIRSEIASLHGQRREFEREHRRLREDAHDQIDRKVADARAHVDGLLETYGPEVSGFPLSGANLADPSAPSLVDLHVMHRLAEDVAFVTKLHEAIDASPEAFSPLSRAEYEATLVDFDRRIEELELELQRRVVERQQAEAARAARDLQEKAGVRS